MERSSRSRGGDQLSGARRLALLGGLGGGPLQIDLGEGVLLRRLGESDRELLRGDDGPFAPTPGEIAASRYVVEQRLGEGAGEQAASASASGPLEDVLRALRLLGPGRPGASHLWILPGEGRGGVLVPGPERGAPRLAGMGRRLGGSRTGELRRILAALRRSRGVHLELILSRFDSAFDARPAADHLIDLWIALEALLLPEADREPRLRASLRLAHLLGETAEERQRIAARTEESMGRRRDIHRARAEEEQLLDSVAEMRELTRRALRARLLAPPQGGLPGLDRRLFGA